MEGSDSELEKVDSEEVIAEIRKEDDEDGTIFFNAYIPGRKERVGYAELIDGGGGVLLVKDVKVEVQFRGLGIGSKIRDAFTKYFQDTGIEGVLHERIQEIGKRNFYTKKKIWKRDPPENGRVSRVHRINNL